jgi:hypothetical protein
MSTNGSWVACCVQPMARCTRRGCVSLLGRPFFGCHSIPHNYSIGSHRNRPCVTVGDKQGRPGAGICGLRVGGVATLTFESVCSDPTTPVVRDYATAVEKYNRCIVFHLNAYCQGILRAYIQPIRLLCPLGDTT